jgi:hypothetical protein
VESLHGGISQAERDRVMKKLRAGTLELVVATDVAARGLDIGHLSHVVNYDVPSSPDVYVHRIGRTGRAGREGVAITLAEPREHWMLKNIERATKQKIEMGSVPTVADLRAKRLELTKASLREALLAGTFDGYRVVVESLAEEFDPLDIAAAAVRMAEGEAGAVPDDVHEIPAVAAPPGPARGPSGPRSDVKGKKWAPRKTAEGNTRIFIGAGRGEGVKPGDLVGAIVKLAKLPPRDVGSIQISERFSLVEVPEALAEKVIGALRATGIRGNKVTVRRDKEQGAEGAGGRERAGRIALRFRQDDLETFDQPRTTTPANEPACRSLAPARRCRMTLTPSRARGRARGSPSCRAAGTGEAMALGTRRRSASSAASWREGLVVGLFIESSAGMLLSLSVSQASITDASQIEKRAGGGPQT